jgi:type II secretory pathway component PulC
MGQLGIRIINIALFTTSCFFSAGVFNHVAESQLAPDHVSAFQPVTIAASEPPKWEERNEILERNLFGAKVGADDGADLAPPPTPPEEEAKLTKLPIKLLGTLAGEPASLSSAVVQNTREKKHQVVQVGDTLKAYDYVTVTSIEPRRILLRNRDVTEELLLTKIGSKSAPAASAAKSSSRSRMQRMRDRNKRKRGRPPKSSESDAADKASAEEIQGAMTQDLMRDLEPAYDESGKITGVLVGDIKGGGLLARAGLATDDVIESINGIPIDSAGAAARVLRELSKCKPLTGSVLGPGGSRTLEISQALLKEMNCTN